MSARFTTLLLFSLATPALMVAQSQAALEHMAQRYTPAQLEDMQTNTHYKYVGMLFYYSSSFLVNEHRESRAATEEEIAAIDLTQYDQQRRSNENVTVFDAAIGKYVVLLSREEAERMLLLTMNTEDVNAYQAYKAAAQRDPASKQ